MPRPKESRWPSPRPDTGTAKRGDQTPRAKHDARRTRPQLQCRYLDHSPRDPRPVSYTAMSIEPWHPISGYIHVPGIWIDDYPVDFSRIHWPRMTEVIAHRQLKTGFAAEITREGVVRFRFSGTSLDPGPLDVNAVTLEQHAELARIVHGRSEALTFHAACLAMARGEADNSAGHSAANVTPAVIIHWNDGLTNPVSMDRGIMGALMARASGHRLPLISSLQRNETLQWTAPAIAERSFELFDKFYSAGRARFIRAVNFLVNASDHMGRNEYVQAFVLAWTVTEHCISRCWDRTLEHLAHGKLPQSAINFIQIKSEKQKMKPAEFPVALRIATLQLVDPSAEHYKRAESLRDLRNKFVHDLALIAPEDGLMSTEVGLQMLKAVYRMDLRLSSGYAYIL